MEKEPEPQKEELTANSFQPFYERFPNRFPIPFVVKLLISLLLGFLFLAPHYRVVGEDLLEDWSWLLCVVIVTAMITLYYATHTFRSMFRQLNVRLQTQEPALIDKAYFNKVRHYLSDKMFILFGLLFAVLNCGVGWSLCIPYEDQWAIATTYLGFFISGFVCGMAVCGIRGVVITLDEYLSHEPKVEYTNPDGCGGFLFFGDALIVFAGVTLVVGLLISLYILEFLWCPIEQSFAMPRVVMWLWIALPFMLSLTILLTPASRANRSLMNHKIQKEVELALAFEKAREALGQAGMDANRREELRQEIDYYGKLRTQLHNMRSWPFNTQSNIKALILFASNAYVAFESIRGLLSGG